MFGLYGMDSQILINVRGGLTVAESNRKFQDDLKILLETQKGTMIGDPEFGSNLYTYLYEPASEATASLIRTELDTVVSMYYSNFVIQSVDVYFKEKSIGLNITYSIVNSNVTESVTLEFIRGW